MKAIFLSQTAMKNRGVGKSRFTEFFLVLLIKLLLLLTYFRPPLYMEMKFKMKVKENEMY